MKQNFKISIALASTLLLVACNFDESFSNEYHPAPVYSTGSQVTPGNRSVTTGRPFRYDSVQSTGSMVNPPSEYRTTTTRTRETPVVVTPPGQPNMASPVIPIASPRPYPAPVVSRPTPVTSASPSMDNDAPVYSTPSAVTGSYNGS